MKFSVHSTTGRWGAWLDAASEEEDQPDGGAPEAASTRGWRVGNPTWVGPANGIRYRVSGRVAGLRASFVRSPEVKIPLRAVASAGSPPIVPRAAWGADESIRRNAPEYAAAIRFAIVHHTAGPNSYSPSQAAAIMRGIQIYHVKSNGWNDIGYNFLVDRYGTVYEGRSGGIDRNVVGAHARGFNTGSAGVAVIGTFETAASPPRPRPRSRTFSPGGSTSPTSIRFRRSPPSPAAASATRPAFPSSLRAVSGHRDTGLTSCPGDQLYAQLGAIAGKRNARACPKLFEPKLTGGLGGLVRFRARVSSRSPGRCPSPTRPASSSAAGAGQGPTVDWTWDASLVTAAGIRWRIDVPGATPTAGTIGKTGAGGGPLAITGLSADPETISPNDDGAAESSTITYTTTAAATVTATLLDAVAGQVAELAAGDESGGRRAHAHLRRARAAGRRLHRRDHGGGYDGTSVAQQVQITITRTLGSASLAPAVFTPNGDGKGDELEVSFQLARAGNGEATRSPRRNMGRDPVCRPAPGRGPEPRLGRRQAGGSRTGRLVRRRRRGDGHGRHLARAPVPEGRVTPLRSSSSPGRRGSGSPRLPP